MDEISVCVRVFEIACRIHSRVRVCVACNCVFELPRVCHITRPDQSLKSDIGKPIDKSLSIDKIILIDIDCNDQSIEIDTHNFFPKSIDFIDFIDRRKTFNFGILKYCFLSLRNNNRWI